MHTQEKLLNVSIALSLLSWAVYGVWRIEGPWLQAPVRLSLMVLQMLVGILFLLRRPARVNGDSNSLLRAVPSLLVSGLLFKLSHPLDIWPSFAEIMFVIGTAMAVFTFAYLARDFAILPARREIVAAGPYRILRHPAYFGEFLMLTACVLAKPEWPILVLYATVIPLLVLRIQEEERLLSADHAYRKYKAKVRWRLMPGLW